MLWVFSGRVSLQMSAPQLTPHLPAEGHIPGDTTRGGALATAGWGQPGEGHPEAGGVSADMEELAQFRACPELVRCAPAIPCHLCLKLWEQQEGNYSAAFSAIWL